GGGRAGQPDPGGDRPRPRRRDRLGSRTADERPRGPAPGGGGRGRRERRGAGPRGLGDRGGGRGGGPRGRRAGGGGGAGDAGGGRLAGEPWAGPVVFAETADGEAVRALSDAAVRGLALAGVEAAEAHDLLLGRADLAEAPGVSHAALIARGFTDHEIAAVEAAL